MSDYLFKQSDKNIEANLRRLWRCDELVMIGEYQHSSSPREPEFGYISRPYINDRNIYYPVNDHKRHVGIRVPKSNDLIVGNYYKIKAKIAPIELRRQLNNPYLLIWDDTESIEFASEFITPREFVELWFHQTGSTPKDAATIASQLKLNSLELYTQTERFIFELIQNADDSDNIKGINVELHLLNNYLLFRHNGKFFDRDDVRAIADAAQSNKSESVRQTGYKGIGFKSVFTDARCVYIRSGSYSFKFDKNDSIYSDFNKLYERHIRLLSNSPKDHELFQIDYLKNKDKYENIDNVPWQIKPIWINKSQLSKELINSDFFKHAEVNIALEIGENVINSKKYSSMVESILGKPKFILFLRNTRKFEYYKLESDYLEKKQSIELHDNGNLMSISHNDNHVATFSKIHFDVEINNREFQKAGFNVEKFEEKPGVFKFKDEYGEIKSIPEKLGLLSSTRITFASQIKDNEVVKLDKSHSILYNYLPTSDQRFGFPFLVNADFITNTSREFILKENKWNQYLMHHIGQNCVRCLSSLCEVQELIQGKLVRKYVKSYLTLLPDFLLNEDDEELSEINKAFNSGFLSSVNTTNFIIDQFNEVKSTSEIILDETQFSTVLNPDIFNRISETSKVLPSSEISNKILNKEYLKIEKYSVDKLTLHLQDKSKQHSLAEVLSFLDLERYKKFLEWLDQYYHIYDIKEEWIFQLPIIRRGDLVLTLNEVLGLKDFVFKTEKTSKIEDVLEKLGFALSEFSLDDEYLKHIKPILLSKDSHLQSDVKLYNHITSDKDLRELQPIEKNRILIFFKGLYQIGPSDYAANLNLFQSNTRKSRALNNLISNKEIEKLPDWLLDFVILEAEELAISAEFHKELLFEKDILEKLFCNTETYSEIVKGINTENVEVFYEYLLKLNESKADGFEIDKTIPWVYIESGLNFAKDSDVYLPDSFTKLKKTKYESVKTVIELISDEKLPHFSALQIKVPFALGGNKFQLQKIKPKENLLEHSIVNDFLDWAEANGEHDLLNNFSFTKVGDKFSIGRVEGNVTYYTTDLGLIQLIEVSILNSRLNLFPSDLYTKQRCKIGLLEEVSILKYLLEEGCASLDLAKYIQSSNDPNLSLLFFENLLELNINTSRFYKSSDDVFIILKLATQYVVTDKDKLKSFKNKITIDGQPLLERAISEDVYFYDKHVGLKTKLSDILPDYKNRTFPLMEIIEKFVGFDDNKNLIAILKDESRTPKKILKELNDLKLAFYDPAQTLFLSFYQSLYPEESVLQDKIFLVDDQEINRDAFEKEVGKFLDYCVMENDFIGFLDHSIIDSFNPVSIITNDYYSTESEMLPYWLRTWLNGEHDEKKNMFIKKLNINGEDSHVVKLRKGLCGDTSVNMDAARGGITPELLKNTFEWLLKEYPNKLYNSTVLKPLYERANVLDIPIFEIPLPLPVNIEGNSYSLNIPSEAMEFHQIWSGWGNFKNEIWTFLKNKNCLILDNLLPEKYLEKLGPLKLEVETIINSVELKKGLRDLNAWFYKYWESKDNCIIKIYRGDKLPQIVLYNNQTIKTFNDGLSAKIDGEYIVAESIETSIPHSIKDLIPEFFHELNSWKSDFDNNRTERKLTPQEEDAIMKLFDGVVPEGLRKNQNLSALASALIFLEEKGYDVYQANNALINTHEYAQLAPVYKNGEEYIIMCRSARLGLLYLTKQAWDRLDQPDVMLFADRGYDDPGLFKTKQDVLDINIDNPTDFQLMRIESRANAQDLDQMLKGNFEDASRLWIILRLKGNEYFDKLFFERPETNNTTFNIAQVKTDDDGGY
jgi:hypothetical protein